jgi:hypothetical protein
VQSRLLAELVTRFPKQQVLFAVLLTQVLTKQLPANIVLHYRIEALCPLSYLLRTHTTQHNTTPATAPVFTKLPGSVSHTSHLSVRQSVNPSITDCYIHHTTLTVCTFHTQLSIPLSILLSIPPSPSPSPSSSPSPSPSPSPLPLLSLLLLLLTCMSLPRCPTSAAVLYCCSIRCGQ